MAEIDACQATCEANLAALNNTVQADFDAVQSDLDTGIIVPN